MKDDSGQIHKVKPQNLQRALDSGIYSPATRDEIAAYREQKAYDRQDTLTKVGAFVQKTLGDFTDAGTQVAQAAGRALLAPSEEAVKYKFGVKGEGASWTQKADEALQNLPTGQAIVAGGVGALQRAAGFSEEEIANRGEVMRQTMAGLPETAKVAAQVLGNVLSAEAGGAIVKGLSSVREATAGFTGAMKAAGYSAEYADKIARGLHAIGPEGIQEAITGGAEAIGIGAKAAKVGGKIGMMAAENVGFQYQGARDEKWFHNEPLTSEAALATIKSGAVWGAGLGLAGGMLGIGLEARAAAKAAKAESVFGPSAATKAMEDTAADIARISRDGVRQWPDPYALR
jgi:hypothetical protein